MYFSLVPYSISSLLLSQELTDLHLGFGKADIFQPRDHGSLRVNLTSCLANGSGGAFLSTFNVL